MVIVSSVKGNHFNIELALAVAVDVHCSVIDNVLLLLKSCTVKNPHFCGQPSFNLQSFPGFPAFRFVGTNISHSSTLDCLLFTQCPLTSQPPLSEGTVSIGLLDNNCTSNILYSYTKNIFKLILKKYFNSCMK